MFRDLRMACMDACPVDTEHLTHFTDMNRQLVEQGDVDVNIQDVFGNVMQQGNTFGENAQARLDWTEDLDFEVPVRVTGVILIEMPRNQRVGLLWWRGRRALDGSRGGSQPSEERLRETVEDTDADHVE